MLVDLHNHTSRCKHAVGTPREYLDRAVLLGIDVYGFADHAPLWYFDEEYRMGREELEEYEREIRQLAAEYRHRIEVLVGYEVDFTPRSKFFNPILDRPVDYLIGSVHFLDRWGFDNPKFIHLWRERDVDEVYREYFEVVLEMVKSGHFQIVGHIDLVKVFGYRPSVKCEELVAPVLEEAKRRGVAVELNSAGWRKPVREQYPSEEILGLMREVGVDITFGSDAHSPDQVGYRLEELVQLAKKFGWREGVYFKNKRPVKFPL
jgi:histidinol-phosphatase (PHP family)